MGDAGAVELAAPARASARAIGSCKAICSSNAAPVSQRGDFLADTQDS